MLYIPLHYFTVPFSASNLILLLTLLLILLLVIPLLSCPKVLC